MCESPGTSPVTVLAPVLNINTLSYCDPVYVNPRHSVSTGVKILVPEPVSTWILPLHIVNTGAKY